MNKVRIRIENESNSGKRRGWSKLVTSVDKSKTNGYAFEGTFLNEQEYDLPVGGIIIKKNPEGSVKNSWSAGVCLRIQPDGSLLRLHNETYEWETEFLSFRDFVAECLKQSQQESSEPSSEEKIKLIIEKYGADKVLAALNNAGMV